MIPLEEIFCVIDDFCKNFESELKSKILPSPNRRRNRTCAINYKEDSQKEQALGRSVGGFLSKVSAAFAKTY